jgi:transposase
MADLHPVCQRKLIAFEHSILLRLMAARVAKFILSRAINPANIFTGVERMKDILDCCCGLDIHKDTIVACLLKGPVNMQPTSEIRTFTTLIHDIEELKNWLESHGCKHVAMESTGIYWQPVYEVLELAFNGDMSLVVVNARHMKNVPGKKTDMKDAEWIATLLRAGLLNSSFVPTKEIRELRHLTRYRKSIISEITSQKNRIEKFLQSSGFRLSTFLSDIFGASGRNIINHLANHGSITLQDLDVYLKTKTRHKMNDIMTTMNGRLSSHQKLFLKMLLKHLEQLESNLSEVEAEIATEVQKFEHQLGIIDSIPGIDKTAASSIIAEIGIDMSKFKTAEHICSWAGLSPGSNESAGKKKSKIQ